MKSTLETHPTFYVVGMAVRSNQCFEEMHETSRIFPVVRDFVHSNLASKIPNRIQPGILICGYTDYESDYQGDYTYFIGEKVKDIDMVVPEGLQLITVPEQLYLKITNGPDCMPAVIKDPWQKVCAMSPQELGGERSYVVDFEVYDERSRDHAAITLDIYVGLK